MKSKSKDTAVGCGGCLVLLILLFEGCTALIGGESVDEATESPKTLVSEDQSKAKTSSVELSTAMQYQAGILENSDDLTASQTYKVDLLTAADASPLAQLTLLSIDEEELYSFKPEVCQLMEQVGEDNYSLVVAFAAEQIQSGAENSLSDEDATAMGEPIVYGTALNGCN